jgi:hypothetical protein
MTAADCPMGRRCQPTGALGGLGLCYMMRDGGADSGSGGGDSGGSDATMGSDATSDAAAD